MGKITINVKWLLVAVAVITFGVGGYFAGSITSQASTTSIEPKIPEVNIPIASESSSNLTEPVSDISSVPVLPATSALTLSSTQLNDMLQAALAGERHFQQLANIISAIERNGLAGVEFTPSQIDELAAKAIPELTYAQDKIGDYIAIAGVSDSILDNFRNDPEYKFGCYASLGCG